MTGVPFVQTLAETCAKTDWQVHPRANLVTMPAHKVGRAPPPGERTEQRAAEGSLPTTSTLIALVTSAQTPRRRQTPSPGEDPEKVAGE